MLFIGTENETKRCPRRLLIDSPELAELLTLRRRHGDQLQALGVDERLTAAALDGLDALDGGVAWRSEDEIRQLTKERGKK